MTDPNFVARALALIDAASKNELEAVALQLEFHTEKKEDAVRLLVALASAAAGLLDRLVASGADRAAVLRELQDEGTP